MLLPADVIPYLTHADPLVRDHAVGYFRETHDIGPLTADDLWCAFDQYGRIDSRRCGVFELTQVPQTSTSLDRLLGLAASSADAETDDEIHRVMVHVDLSLLRSHRDRMLATPRLPSHVRRHLEERLALADAPAERCWQQLMQVAASLDARPDEQPKDGLAAADRLVEAIARDPASVTDRAMARLIDPMAIGTWEEIFAAKVLGAARHTPAIGPLLRKLIDDEADYLHDAVIDALTGIGGVEVLNGIEAFYPDQSWGARLSAAVPVSRIKRPESIATLLRLLKHEPDAGLQVQLLGGLSELGSLEGLERSRQVIADAPDERERLGLCESLLAVSTMLGRTLPDAQTWRAALARRDKRVRERMARFDADPQSSFQEIVRVLEEKRAAAEPAKLQSDRDMILPFTRVEKTPGRNDACPCGSGKKYKKCCAD